MTRQAKDGSFPGAEKSIWSATDGDMREQVPGSFSWMRADAGHIKHLIALAATAGDAISFAHNRANSGGSITILSGPHRPRWYADDVAGANKLLSDLAARYEG